MSTTQPIREMEDVQRMKEYFLEQENYRNHCLITMGFNTALRISDILRLQWKDVYDFDKRKYCFYMNITEKKTGKKNRICLNDSIIHCLKDYRKKRKAVSPADFIICHSNDSSKAISRVQAYRIIRNAAEELSIDGHISCHSMRKTFGYHAWRSGVNSVMLMNIYNHSSYETTKRYLGIEQEDKDNVFLKINL